VNKVGKGAILRRAGTGSETELLKKIERVMRPAAGGDKEQGLCLGIGDDAALWKPHAGFEAVLTADWFLEGTHFTKKAHPPDSVGWKCLARAVSDVAAMAGNPCCFLLSLALPESCTGKWMDEFLGGLKRASRRLRCPLAGGDTTLRKEILINITVIGEVEKGRAATRKGARAGHQIFVSGRLGEAELGLRLVRSGFKGAGREGALLRKHFYPEARVALGSWLGARRMPTAMIDLSDGLSTDLMRLCKASGVGARVYLDKLPLASGIFPDKFDEPKRIDAALNGGDDYELLFSVARRDARKIPKRISGVRLTEIGEITRGSEVRTVDSSGEEIPLRAAGWDPFRK
jgi:thiamine-monophosphate kinase